MLTTSKASAAAVPLHLWFVGGLSLVWNAFGAFDYLMTQFQVSAYLNQFTPAQLDYFYGFPAWVDGAWALGVWGSVLGSVALLLRRAWARWAFAASLLGLTGTSLYTLVLTSGTEIMGGGAAIVFSVIIWIITIGLLGYAQWMTGRGVLRS